MIKKICFLTLIILLSSCIPAPVPTPIPSATPTLSPTGTPTPEQFSGKLFFDMNGSGVQDDTSFFYDREQFEDDTQPLQADLFNKINEYVDRHPEIKNGDLITIKEPGLSNYLVCADDDCATTDIDGNFNIPGTEITSSLRIVDPHKGETSLEMKYINLPKESIVIPSWEWNNISYPEEKLKDTSIIPIENNFKLKTGNTAVGLMQTKLALCPVDLSLPDVYIFEFYIPKKHAGLDIAGPYGTPHVSPGKCIVDSLYIQDDGGQGILLRCSNVNAVKVGLHHVDFSYNNFETLAWFGIPKNTLFDENNEPILNTMNILPSKNGTLYMGENLHLYMASTGRSGLVHTHVGIWTLIDNKFSDWNDPQAYLACAE